MNEQNLATEMAHMRKQLNEVHTALVGNQISQDGGLVKRMTVMEDRQIKMEKKQTVLGVHFKILWGAAGAVVMAIYSLIIKK